MVRYHCLNLYNSQIHHHCLTRREWNEKKTTCPDCRNLHLEMPSDCRELPLLVSWMSSIDGKCIYCIIAEISKVLVALDPLIGPVEFEN
ncbi:hypothetical protein BLOT_004299 [Blomia tropicalis]|nr:hypothetical protein BLOT_004299 [Blomia tropicalis]